MRSNHNVSESVSTGGTGKDRGVNQVLQGFVTFKEKGTFGAVKINLGTGFNELYCVHDPEGYVICSPDDQEYYTGL